MKRWILSLLAGAVLATSTPAVARDDDSRLCCVYTGLCCIGYYWDTWWDQYSGDWPDWF